jgi:hypothetical protein
LSRLARNSAHSAWRTRSRFHFSVGVASIGCRSVRSQAG